MSDITLKYSAELSSSVVSQAEKDRAMYLGISFNGSQFACGEFKYDKLQDAIAYAELVISRDGGQPAVSGPAEWIERSGPTDIDQALMRKHGISFEQWRYKYQDFSYERLADAVSYATRQSASTSPS